MPGRANKDYRCAVCGRALASEAEFSRAYPVFELLRPDDAGWVLTGICRECVAKAAAADVPLAPPPQSSGATTTHLSGRKVQ